MTTLEAINSLPKSPEQIRKLFQELGIKGGICESSGCPIARYLKLKTNSIHIVSSVRIYQCNDKYEYKTPEHVAQFMANFDQGYYPELEK